MEPTVSTLILSFTAAVDSNNFSTLNLGLSNHESGQGKHEDK